MSAKLCALLAMVNDSLFILFGEKKIFWGRTRKLLQPNISLWSESLQIIPGRNDSFCPNNETGRSSTAKYTLFA